MTERDLEHYRSRSFWLSSGQYEPEPRLAGDVRADVVIVGGGFTGLSTAYHLKKEKPDLDVVLLEAEYIAYGASGRNAGFAMTLFGLHVDVTRARFGRKKAVAAHRFMERSVDYMGELVEANRIDCDWERNGLLVVATSPKHLKRLEKEVATWKKLGVGDIELLDQNETRARVNSPYYLGAKYEERCAILNPARFAWGMKKACLGLRVRIFESSPAEEIRYKKEIRVKTEHGSVTADQLVLATNAFHLPRKLLRRKAVPVYTYIVLTEPLTDAQLEPIGWKGREGIEDARNLVHYYRLTADNRLLMGGGDVRYFYGSRTVPDQDRHAPTFDELEHFVRTLFPSLAEARMAYRWGGPVSAPLDMVPAMGYVGRNKNVVFSLGPVGHGVAFTQLAGSVLKDLVLEQDGEFTDVFFVNRFVTPMPPEPLRTVVARGIISGMRVHDRRCERKVFKKRP